MILTALAPLPERDEISFTLQQPKTPKLHRASIDQRSLTEASYRLKKGSVEDRIRYIQLNAKTRYRAPHLVDPDFLAQIHAWLEKPKEAFRLRKEAFLDLWMSQEEKDVFSSHWKSSFTDQERLDFMDQIFQSDRWRDQFLKEKRWPKEASAPGARAFKLKQVNAKPLIFAHYSIDGWSREFWDLVPTFMQDRDGGAQNAILRALSTQSSWPDRVWKFVPRLLTDDSERVRLAIVKALESQSSWPETIGPHLARLLKDQNEGIRSAVVSILKDEQRLWPDSFWALVPNILRSTNGYFRDLMGELLRSRNSWPKSFWTVVPRFLKHPDARVRLVMIKAINSEMIKRIKPIWSHVPILLDDANRDVQRTMVNALGHEPFWPKEVWEKVPDLLASEDQRVRLATVSALSIQDRWPAPVWEEFHKLLREAADSDPEDLNNSDVIYYALTALRYQKSWSEAVWIAIERILRSGARLMPEHTLIEALRSQSVVPPEIQRLTRQLGLDVFEKNEE